jgi:COX assembly mitochondrial protein 1
MAIMAPPTVEEEVPRLPMPSRNPLPLSTAQESQVRELYHARVRGYCAAEIKRLSPLPTLSWAFTDFA